MSWYSRLLDTFLPGRLDRELDEEMRYHIEMRTEGYRRDGLSSDEAHRKALRRFGSPLLTRERVHDVRLLVWLDSVRQDLWLGLRLLRRSPALAVAAVLSLGLAIGATTGVFAVGDALLIRPLPVDRPDELVVLQWHSTQWPKIGAWGTGDDDDNAFSFSYPIYEELAKTPGIDLAGSQHLRGAITLVKGEAGTAEGALVTGGFFRVLGVKPAIGRLFVDSDNSVASTPVVVVSHRFWQNAFGGDPAAVGSAMRVNGQTFTIVGVTPAAFFGAMPGQWTDLYLPACRVGNLKPEMAADSPLTSDSFWWLELVGRLKPGASEAAVKASLGMKFAGMVRPLITEPKQNATFGTRPGARGFAFEDADKIRPATILMSLVVLVLLIACSNVANLLLARGAARQKEAALRLALGAGRLRLVRQHLTESLMLALINGTGGFLFARWFSVAMLSLVPANGGMDLDLGFSWRVLGFNVGISVVAGLLVGLAPAITLSRSSVAAAVRAGTTVRSGWGRRLGLGRPLVAVQIALSLLLLVTAGLFVRTLGNLEAVPLGFNPEGLVLFSLNPTAAGYSPVQKAQATERVADRLRQIPHVSAVTWSTFALVDGVGWNSRLRLPGDSASRRPPCNLLWVGPGFHRVLEMPLVAGRLFDDRDGTTATKVAIVNQSFVAKYLGGVPPLGRTFVAQLGRTPLTLEIVGVVRDSKYNVIRRPEAPIAYLPDAQHLIPDGPTFALKASGDMAQLPDEIRRAVHEMEPTLPVTRIRTYREQIGQQLSMERSLSVLASAFGAVALLLAAVGLYGVVAFAVARRTAEMGVRLALGASRGAVLKLMLMDSAKVVVPGACVGMAAALAATRYVKSLLYELKPTDPITILAATLLLLAVATIAAYIPARRAAGIDPVDALRCE